MCSSVHKERPAAATTIMEITDRKQIEEALRVSEEKYRKIIEQMEEGYFEVDLDGNFTFVNDAEINIFGYPRDELIGMNYRQYQDETSAQKIYKLFIKVYKIGGFTLTQVADSIVPELYEVRSLLM
ncbi:MAG: PAS domain-containing protein [Smithellaceae bacterium]